jgi:hypothetical protein
VTAGRSIATDAVVSQRALAFIETGAGDRLTPAVLTGWKPSRVV